MLAQRQNATAGIEPALVLDDDMPFGVVILLHNASVGSITAVAYLDGNGGDMVSATRVASFTLAAGATQPFEIRGVLKKGATLGFSSSATASLNVLILAGSSLP